MYDGFLLALIFFLGFIMGAFCLYIFLGHQNKQLLCLVTKEQTLKEQIQESLQARINELSDIKKNMKETFELISRESLLSNTNMLNTSFKQSLREFFMHNEKEREQSSKELLNIVSPLKESLLLVDKKISDLEKLRSNAHGSLTEQLNSLLSTQNCLIKETNLLKNSLTSPSIRGRWGEMQLRRVVELSGLSSYCDFLEQKTITTQDDISLRPDMIITLPQNKKIVIDAKAPLDSFLDSQRKDFDVDEQKQSLDLALSLRRHIAILKKKSYAKYLEQTPEFVILFLPGEVFLSKALQVDNSLIDFAAKNEVILATPLTLIAILKAVSFSFSQQAIAQNVEEAKKLSSELIDRIAKVAEHFERLGKSLKNAQESYNQTLVSLKSRVLVTAQKLSNIQSLNTNSQLHDSLRPLDIEVSEVSNDY